MEQTCIFEDYRISQERLCSLMETRLLLERELSELSDRISNFPQLEPEYQDDDSY